MNIADAKRLVVRTFPPPMVRVLKAVWQSMRRWIKQSYFASPHRDVVVLDVSRSESGQLNQPVIVDCLLRGCRDGFYLDIGANHPQFNSNTWFFESERSFSGIAFDPLEKYREEWLQTRPRARFLNVAAGAEEGKVRFFQHANTDGWADQLSFTALSGHAGTDAGKEVQVVAVADLRDLPKDIHFASIDVEGAEPAVLRGFRDVVRPQVLVVENCFGPVGNRALRRQVVEMGYTMVARVSYIDDVFVRSDLAGEVPSLRTLKASRADLFR